MKTLYVLRHGQAAPEDAADSDHSRPLTPRGRSDVQRAAGCLSERPGVPSLILTSSAARALQTAELCWAALSGLPRPTILDGLYLAGPEAYLEALATRAEPHACVMVVGHNPGLEALIYLLTERSEHLATASLVELLLPIAAWSELSRPGYALGRLSLAFRA